ncbi:MULTISPECIES: cyclodeaminase/cyclohydrolase family protein [Dehalobacter]|uniref:Sugar ABC transporter substrate-binding protein n=2 Tax=Dehalobacter restrictus TaxID=55583 RepID=A0A857DFQ7_9FIRM|nr:MULTISPECIES: cyclodeaminase/cyclohydrolase family protein [Dehalobacter]AHF08843.1 sugar ABC transporter substrate-binding protein [Dehalobacter restrictus DSM 9455]MCG1024136.1 cyclodeaminase/cyclohydrolase family protein [Dehalobacter sp.]MDJ0305420.1 cyclodeaminase/cyclohydrolase family protein [Dehalobacter sp.]OCZ50019.1 sugar ABC transporter substrate-binding protein [Dehalobacter sp. TeCB1]QGZ99341.1 sugar ABC transporter substrate-binding protein [Dehalobacter restrictus]
MLKKSCIEFVDALSSKEPVPGGGGASAYVGSIGMALGVMVGSLTVGKKKYADVEADVLVLMEKGQKIIEKLQVLVKEDADAFYPLSQAYGLPKNTEEEIRIKEETLQAALVKATLVPLDIVRCCTDGINLQEEFAQKGTRIAISDVGVGVTFLKAALEGAKLNVLINTQIMKDQVLKQKIETELSELVTTYTAKADRIFAEVQNAITGGK